MKTQYTPGPWARNVSPAWKYPIYEEKNHNKIAYIIKDVGIPETEQEANLNLIAAAPELLEALELLINMEVKGHALIDRMQFSDKGRAISDKVRAAIAKARGNL